MGNSSGHCKAQGQIAYQQCKDNGGAERVCRSVEEAALDACKMGPSSNPIPAVCI